MCTKRATLESLERRTLLVGNPVVVDLLAVYTTQARIDQGGDAAIQSLIQQCVDTTNRALQNSLIPLTIRLVHMEEIAGYTGSGDLFLDRVRLQTPGDGQLDSIHALRNTWGADLVHMVTTNAGAGGNAALLNTLAGPNLDSLAFSVMDQESLQPSNLTMAHELGHTMGGGHERGNPDGAVGPFPYSYGYRYTAPSGAMFNDVMSYSYGNDVPIPYFANPNVSYAGAPTGKPVGDANAADLYSTFIQTAPVVAAHRTTVVADTAGPVATVHRIERAGESLTFAVRYQDATSVDATSIDSNDVFVTTPEGFNLNAELVSIDGGADNYFEKIARYRVTLPASKPATGLLAFSLKPAQVKDVNGAFAPSGLLGWSTGDAAGWDVPSARELGTLSSTIVRDSVGPADVDDIYRFTVTGTSTVTARLSDVTGVAEVFLWQDLNLDARYQSATEFITNSYNPDAGGEHTLAANLPAGEYFLWVYQVTATPYTLSVNAYSDGTLPTATLDATDIRSAGTMFTEFAITYTDDRELNGQTTRYSSPLDVFVQLDGGGSFQFMLFPDPALNSSFQQNAASITINYRLNGPGGGWTSFDDGTYTVKVHQNTGAETRVQDAAGNLIPVMTIGSFRVDVGEPDQTPPVVAAVSAAPVLVTGATTYDFSVTYHDNVAMDAGTFDGSDIRVVGPGGLNIPASVVAVSSAPPRGSNRSVTYRIVPPGGSWDHLDKGTYSIAMQSGQVKDAANNSVAAGTIATINVHPPLPGDATGDDTVNSADFNVLATNFGNNGRGYGHGDFTFDGTVSSADFNVLASYFGTSLPGGAARAAAGGGSSSASLFGGGRIGDDESDNALI